MDRPWPSAAAGHLAATAVDTFGSFGLLFNNAGMSPPQCATIVFDAIRAGKFWIFTHPEFKPAYQQRFDSVMLEINPLYQIYET